MTSLLGSGGGGTAMLLYFPEGNAGEKSRNQHIATDIYLGLLRGRSLSQFDGRTWKADEPQLTIQRGQKRSVASDQQEAKNGDIVELEAIRTPLGSTTLPIPYGTSRVLIRNPEGVMTAPVQIASGEWMDPAGSDHPVNYRLVVDHSRSAGFGSDSTDLPAEKHLEIPTIVKTKRMQTLARRIFPPGLNTAEKITRLQNFFTQEKFMAFTGDNGEDNGAEIDGQMTAFQNLQPIEKFLFLSKKGHCELFSGAAAILLRMAGVPTRMIAGFRISRAPMGDVLNVRSGDGHAWIEYWIPEKGWKALDLTPRFMFAPSFTEYLRTIYDIASAVWYRNITGNESPLQFLKLKDYFNLQALKSSKAEGYISRAQGHIERWAAEEKSTLLWILVYAVALAVCVFLVIRTWFPWILSIRWRVNEGPGWIKQERLRMEQFLVRKLYKRWIHHPATGMDFECAAHDLRILYGEQAAECFGVWRKTYLSARFGKISVYRKEVRSQLRSRYRELQQILGKRGEREDRRGNSDGDSDNPHKAG
jgi:transglutaminase-like putative cysteine protease